MLCTEELPAGVKFHFDELAESGGVVIPHLGTLNR